MLFVQAVKLVVKVLPVVQHVTHCIVIKVVVVKTVQVVAMGRISLASTLVALFTLVLAAGAACGVVPAQLCLWLGLTAIWYIIVREWLCRSGKWGWPQHLIFLLGFALITLLIYSAHL